jgi:2-oxo-4-hydroxy-4-carboxy-5-ureidoimidazoline decarboxylase
VSTTAITIDEVNALDRDTFVARFGHVFESTPALANDAWAARPFADATALTAAFTEAADALDGPARLALLRAHPQLATAGPMTDHSRHEQWSAGLIDLDAESRARIDSGNAAYLDRFGFPFVIAVGGLGRTDVAAALDERLGNDTVDEQAIAFAQVKRIAALRLAQLVTP